MRRHICCSFSGRHCKTSWCRSWTLPSHEQVFTFLFKFFFWSSGPFVHGSPNICLTRWTTMIISKKGAVYGLYDITHEWLPRKGELYGSHDAQDPSCLFIEESEGSAHTYLSHRWELMVTRALVKRMMATMVIGLSVNQNGPLMVYNCRYAHQGWFVGIKR